MHTRFLFAVVVSSFCACGGSTTTMDATPDAGAAGSGGQAGASGAAGAGQAGASGAAGAGQAGASGAAGAGQAGASGAAGAGQAGASGAAGASGGQDAGAPCDGRTISFELTTAGAPTATYCVGSGCSGEWLTITNAVGQPVPISHPCVSECLACAPMGCPALCLLPHPMPAQGERLVWDGRTWSSGMCGQEYTCVNATCAAPGRYVAKMCAAVGSGSDAQTCTTDGTPRCVEVEFDYPSQTTVKGTLGPTK